MLNKRKNQRHFRVCLQTPELSFRAYLTSSSWISNVNAQIVSPLLQSVTPEVCASSLVRLTPLLVRLKNCLLNVALHKTCTSSKALRRQITLNALYASDILILSMSKHCFITCFPVSVGTGELFYSLNLHPKLAPSES